MSVIIQVSLKDTRAPLTGITSKLGLSASCCYGGQDFWLWGCPKQVQAQKRLFGDQLHGPGLSSFSGLSYSFPMLVLIATCPLLPIPGCISIHEQELHEGRAGVPLHGRVHLQP